MRSARRVLVGCSALALAAALLLPAGPLRAAKVVRPFLVYYGAAPARGSKAQARALARCMQDYPVVVLGLATRAPAFAERLRRLMPHTAIYGYADAGHVSLRHVERRLSLLHRLGVQGVLLDDIGMGLSAHAGALRQVVRLAQREGLRVMLNAWDPRDVLDLPLRPGRDAVLCENWVYSGGAWAVPRTPAIYLALRRLEARGVLVFMIVTARGTPSPAAPPAAGVLATARTVFGDYLSLSDPIYSARTQSVFPAGELTRLLRRLSL